jgi:ABC-type multidrug transport system fused ATPase/permease subunit
MCHTVVLTPQIIISSRSIEAVVQITGITAYMLIRCPRLGACALSIIPIVAIVNKYYGNWLSQNARKVQDALAAANSVAQETFSCIRTVIAFASEEFEYDKYVERIDTQYRLNVRQASETFQIESIAGMSADIAFLHTTR